jgi:hypothetical protein
MQGHHWEWQEAASLGVATSHCGVATSHCGSEPQAMASRAQKNEQVYAVAPEEWIAYDVALQHVTPTPEHMFRSYLGKVLRQ